MPSKPRTTAKPATPAKPRGRPRRTPDAAPAKPDQMVKTSNGAGPENSRQIGDMSDETYRPEVAQDVDLVRETLRAICRDAGAPAAARAQAARTLAEMVGALGRHAAPPAPAGKPLADMTRDELERELAGLGGA